MDRSIIPHILTLKGWTVRKMAEELGVSRPAVSNWIAGTRPITRLHELAFRAAAGDTDYYIAAQRAQRGTEPTTAKFRGFL